MREMLYYWSVIEWTDDGVLISASDQSFKNKKEWIIDSGCSHHVTGNDSVFTEVRQHHGERIIVTSDNYAYPVAKEGVVKIRGDNMHIRLDDVYNVPGLKKNLVSVSQINNSGKNVLFCPNDVKMHDNM